MRIDGGPGDGGIPRTVHLQDLADFVLLKDGIEGYRFYPLYVMDLQPVHYVQAAS